MDSGIQERQRKNYNLMRSIYNITMGALITGIGILMFFSEKAGLDLFKQFDPLMIYAFGVLCVLYGGFRLYRGIKKEQ